MKYIISGLITDKVTLAGTCWTLAEFEAPAP